MLKVLIVDDEFIVRVGLKNCIDWEKMNLRLVGEASNGEEALRLIEEEIPDIILLDIMMPVMNGIELINELFSRGIKTNIIILSCHDDYSYVREAFKSGIHDYILKLSANPEEISNVLQSVARRIISDAAFNLPEGSPDKAQKSAGSLEDISKKIYGMDYYIASFYHNTLTFMEASIICDLCVELFAKNQPEGVKSFVTLHDKHIPCVISAFPTCTGQHILDSFKLHLESVNRILLNYISSPPRIGISILKSSPEQIFDAFKESQKAVKASFYKEDKLLSSFSELSFFEPLNPYYSTAFEKNLRTNIERRNISELKNIIGMFFNRVEEYASISPDAVKLNTIEIINTFAIYIRDIGFSLSDLDKEYIYYYQQIAAIMSFSELKAWMGRFLDTLGGFLCHINKGVARTDILEALNYIEENYSRDLTLHELAKHINISKSHLSYLFRKETGETFSDYLNKVRIEKAQELLLSRKYKINEVSEMVGFNNTGYFSKVFKKSTGTSPFDYKNLW